MAVTVGSGRVADNSPLWMPPDIRCELPVSIRKFFECSGFGVRGCSRFTDDSGNVAVLRDQMAAQFVGFGWAVPGRLGGRGVEFGSDGVETADRLDRDGMGSGDRLGQCVVGIREVGSTGGQRTACRLERVRRIAVLRHGHDRTQRPTAGQLTFGDAA